MTITVLPRIDKFGQYVELPGGYPRNGVPSWVRPKYIKRATRIALGEFARKFDLAGSRRPTESYRSGRASDNQSHVLNSLEFLMDQGMLAKNFDRHIDRHVQHVVDVLPFVFDFERLPDYNGGLRRPLQVT